jgi:hypothetical protein
MEHRFVGAFQHINTLGADRIIKDFFGVPVGSGITRDVFVAAVKRRCGGNDGGGSGTEAAALVLWGKLDEDNDGQVTLNEFVTFVCDLRDGKKSSVDMQSQLGKTSVAVVGSVLAWWRSMKSQSLRAVIITHFQLMSSIFVSFPELEAKATAAPSAATASSIVEAGVRNTTSPLAFFKESVNDVTSTVANINVAVVEFITCFVGPRHEPRLLYSTVTIVGLLLVFSTVSRTLKFLMRVKRFSAHDSNILTLVRHYCEKLQLIVIFLTYPALTSAIMRTFVCKKIAQDDYGNPTWWLVDDTVVQCDKSLVVGQNPFAATWEGVATISTNTTAVGGAQTRPYVFLWVYSWCMVVVIIVGFPAILLNRLWFWRHPFDRM